VDRPATGSVGAGYLSMMGGKGVSMGTSSLCMMVASTTKFHPTREGGQGCKGVILVYETVFAGHEISHTYRARCATLTPLEAT